MALSLRIVSRPACCLLLMLAVAGLPLGLLGCHWAPLVGHKAWMLAVACNESSELLPTDSSNFVSHIEALAPSL